MHQPFNLFAPKQDKRFVWLVIVAGIMAAVLLSYPVMNEASWDPDSIMAVIKKQQTLKTLFDTLIAFCVAILGSYIYSRLEDRKLRQTVEALEKEVPTELVNSVLETLKAFDHHLKNYRVEVELRHGESDPYILSMRYSYSKTFQRTRNLGFKITENTLQQCATDRPALKDRYLDNEFFWTVLAHRAALTLNPFVSDLRINNLSLSIKNEGNGFFSAVIPDEVDITTEIFFSYRVQMNVRRQDNAYISVPAPSKQACVSFNYREVKDEVDVEATSTYQGNRLDPGGEIHNSEDGFIELSNLGWVVPDSACTFIWFQKDANSTTVQS
ncbi:MAG: hypothetical protein FD135_3724 [Comamonadaceae bacterium]|nr:MAG: hypothetical protein FD135_3724 [Comamonadaceae bacterium]